MRRYLMMCIKSTSSANDRGVAIIYSARSAVSSASFLDFVDDNNLGISCMEKKMGKHHECAFTQVV